MFFWAAQIKGVLGRVARRRFICRFAVPEASVPDGAFGCHPREHGLLGIYVIVDRHLLLPGM
jgi:hypothetical protein